MTRKSFIKVESKPTFRDVRGRWAKTEDSIIKHWQKSGMFKLGSSLRDEMQKEAPKKTGAFANKIGFKTFSSGASTGFRIFMPEPLGTFITKGTRPHVIRANKAKALYFYWPKVSAYTVVPKAGGFSTHFSGGKLWIGKGYVNHPGTDPNQFDKRAYANWLPTARTMLNRISKSFQTEFTK